MQEDIKSPVDLQLAATSQNTTEENSHPRTDAPVKSGLQDSTSSPLHLSHPPTKPSSHINAPPSIATVPTRVGTLSWQQRPSSRGSTGARVRPLSMVATENNATRSPRTTPDPAAANEDVAPRHEIAQSLGLKDAAWFRQTEDRGAGSAAYRKNQDDGTTEKTSVAGKMRLPGLLGESSVEPEKDSSLPSRSLRSASPSVEGSTYGSSSWDPKNPDLASVSSASGIQSPLPILSSQKFEPPLSDKSSNNLSEASVSVRAMAMSPSQGRISPERMERPPSPTKGLGGFVQSAMLKRSDSVNKRWSAQAGPGLSRGNSMVSNRSGYEGSRPMMGGISPPKDLRPDGRSRENSPHQNSRPTSSHSYATLTESRAENEGLGTSSSNAGVKDSSDATFAKPALPYHKSTASMTNNQKGVDKEALVNQLPPSPGKKWSPTKASWLESAIQKPDSPKPKTPAPQQPSWMVNISKAKQERASIDIGKSGVPGESLNRSPPPGPLKKPLTFGGTPKHLNSSTATPPIKPSREITPLNILERKDRTEELEGLSKSTTATNEPMIEKTASIPSSPSLSTAGSIVLKSQTITGSPSSSKSKPETPPKLDFRSNLKPRRTSVGKDNKEEVEFKNVFGKLKRTQTQNYVPPDELKDNILRGKAGLAATGGPKKTERKDEFKESLLKQKEAIKSGPPSVPRKPSSSSTAISQDLPIPEAIAMRNGLTRSESGLKTISADSRVQNENTLKPSESVPALKRLRDKPELELSNEQPSTLQKAPPIKGKQGDHFNSSLAGLLSRGPPPIIHGTKPTTTMDSNPLPGTGSSLDFTEGSPTNGTTLNHMTKTRARGPKRRLPAIGTLDSSTDRAISNSAAGTNMRNLDSMHQEPNTRSESPSISETKSKPDARPLTSISNNSGRVSSQPLSPRKPSTNVSLIEETKPIPPVSKSSTKTASPIAVKPSPLVRPKPSTQVVDEQPRKPQSSSNQGLLSSPQKLLYEGEPLSSLSIVSTPQGHRQTNQEIIQPYDSTERKANVEDTSPTFDSNNSVQATSRVGLPNRKHEERTSRNPSLPLEKPRKEFVGLGIQSTHHDTHGPASLDPNLPSPPIGSPALPKLPGSPPLPGKKPASITNRVASSTYSRQPKPQPSKSLVPSNAEVSQLLASVFGDVQNSNLKINVDAQSVLASRSPNDGSDKIKTLRKQIWELAGHGRSIPVPSHQEHILFEESLYICTHVFGTPSGTRTTEIYLWVGSGVAQSAAEDAQLFARKVAKENNGKLLILYQGKESSNFFQALGGIVITRRGSSARGDSPSKATATYMLCGRRHVGQIAFDEVDFNTQSLCKGFPFIISARFGKLYLWKGSGSGADELGCARLIGMDLGLTGEIEEVDEGQEPAAFWESLPGGRRDFAVADEVQHWHLKPSCEKYATRLFSIDVEAHRPKSSSGFNMWGRRGSAPPEDNGVMVARIGEIAPFTQADVFRDGIHVLDSFFEIFV